MLEDTAGPTGDETPAGPIAEAAAEAPAKPAVKKTTRKRTTKKVAAAEPAAEPAADVAVDAPAEAPVDEPEAKPAKKAAAKKTAAKKTAAKKAAAKKTAAKKTTTKKAASKKAADAPAEDAPAEAAPAAEETAPAAAGAAPLFQAPEKPTVTRRTRKKAEPEPEAAAPAEEAEEEKPEDAEEQSGESGDQSGDSDSESGEGGGNRRRRRRGGRRRRKSGEGGDDSSDDSDSDDDAAEDKQGKQEKQGGSKQDEKKDDDKGESTSSRRRRRRRRAGDDDNDGGDDPENTVTRVRKGRSAEDQITAVSGSTRLEAKKQRRREGREAGRRRAPIVSEAEFLARRESVDRTMVIRQREDLTQIAVLEDKVLVEHYVARESQTSLIGNVYLGRVQNVLPSMEAAFIDIGKGRNAVLYAGEVNWSALGHKDGQPRKIESVLTSGQPVLVQVTKDPIGHKGARLTSQISLAGRFLVYVPDGTTSGISRKLPDTERNRLKTLLKEIVPDTAGVIVRTAAEGASEDELTRDVERLKARWEDIEKKAKGNAPQLLYGEPDLTLKVVRDLFTEDFGTMVIEGDDAWETVQSYVEHVAPDLAERLEKHEAGDSGKDAFAAYRIDEQIAKALDRKVWLPSGGSLIIDRTEAMTVVDVNTGKFTGSGGNLEETVTKNNLEAAEEVVRQLRLRDIGGIIVVDFIDMVLESNRDLVLRRLVECLGRDRTRHQVAEVTSLGLVQMTRKRIGTGLLEAFSENCEHCQGRGLVLHDAPVEPKKSDSDDGRRSRRGRGGRGKGDDAQDKSSDRSDKGGSNGGNHGGNGNGNGKPPSPKDIAAMPRHEPKPDETGETTPEAPAAEQQAPERAPEPAAEVAAEPTPEPTPEPAPEPAAVETKPKVVTRTRRRSASRPAGPPAGADVPSMDQATPTGGAVGSPAENGAVEPGTVAADPGRPTAEADAQEAPAEAHVEHVPIKKKGSRKR